MSIDIKEWLREKSITEVECLVSDISGIPRGKILPVHKYVSAIETDGLRLPEYVFGQSVTGEYYDSAVLNEIGADIVLRPTPQLAVWFLGMGSQRHKSSMMLSTVTARLCRLRRAPFWRVC